MYRVAQVSPVWETVFLDKFGSFCGQPGPGQAHIQKDEKKEGLLDRQGCQVALFGKKNGFVSC